MDWLHREWAVSYVHNRHVIQADLIPATKGSPEGFEYRPEFLDVEEERILLEMMGSLPFKEAQYREWEAKRRIVSYGGRYDFTHHTLGSAPPIPELLNPLRARIADWAGISSTALQCATVAEYRPGTQLGWHRDVPDFEQVMGVSLGGRARMRLRPYPPKRGARAARVVELAPRSAYAFRGPARWNWQHAISPTKELRYSITFRTLRIKEPE
ncbi:MAG TPA: alpha-ketoglutarate-dependent dioxygenase AlkB [Woeseiaceae bacterium]|nr:alpha-ketoglutarate-dependent dioxygenase AlkB [Woeseiaceae bacterium]